MILLRVLFCGELIYSQDDGRVGILGPSKGGDLSISLCICLSLSVSLFLLLSVSMSVLFLPVLICSQDGGWVDI